jgi:hypothetical protein
MPCGSSKNWCFRGMYHLHHQGENNHWSRKVISCQWLLMSFLVLWWWRRYVPPKHQFLQEPHGVTSQQTAFYKVTVVKVSNLTRKIKLRNYTHIIKNGLRIPGKDKRLLQNLHITLTASITTNNRNGTDFHNFSILGCSLFITFCHNTFTPYIYLTVWLLLFLS